MAERASRLKFTLLARGDGGLSAAKLGLWFCGRQSVSRLTVSNSSVNIIDPAGPLRIGRQISDGPELTPFTVTCGVHLQVLESE